MMKIVERVWIVGAVIVGSACAGAPKPVDQMVDTQAAVRAAEEMGAEREPKAELHMKLAQEELQHARELTQNGDNEEASHVLSRAKADAELALAYARKAKVSASLQQAEAPALSRK